MQGFFTRLCDRLRSGRWLHRRRLLAYGLILGGIELTTLLFFVAGTHGLIVPLKQPTTTDFASFYAAGALADAGTPALAYDQAAHYAAEQQATAPGIIYQFFYYPPVFLLFCAVLARFPYLVAFALFEGATLLLYLLIGRRILDERGGAGLVPLLAFPSVFWTLGFGQNAFLTAALFGGALLLVDRRPAIAGLLFGALCYKPHFGLLIPVALAAGGRWRAFAAAGAAVAGLVLLSGGVFGWETWRAFFTSAFASHATYESGRIGFAGMISPFAAVRLIGGSVVPAYAVQASAMLAAAALVAWVWYREASLPLRAAALCAGTLLALPVALVYDLMLAAVALAWLGRAARQGGFLPWEKLGLGVAFLIPLVARFLGREAHLPLAPFVAVLLLAAVIARFRREAAAGMTVAPPAAPPRRDYGVGREGGLRQA